MNGPLRSKQGCWTCRLRKKKCDERAPHCSTCESLSLPCYGFGPKPDWMDNGEAERAVMEGLKQAVRRTTKQKQKQQPVVRRTESRHQPPALIAMKPPSLSDFDTGNSNGNLHNESNANSHSEGPSSRAISQSSTPSDSSANHFHDSLFSPQGGTSSSEGGRPDYEDYSPRHSVPITPKDSMLLMHFLDHVIPAQYPFYRPHPIDGGRGWLLSLLLQTKPLYHGALALSSYHRLVSILAEARPACRVLAATRHQQHLETCLKEVQRTIREMNQMKSSSPEFSVGTVVSVIQLVFSEAFTGDADAWRMHLRGAVEMYRSAMGGDQKHAKHTEEAQVIIRSSVQLQGEGAELCENVSSMRFMSSAVLWLDIIGSITEGTEPRLLSVDMDLGPESGTRLDEVMGCQNLVMNQIARITALQATVTGTGRSSEFDEQIIDIQNALRRAEQQAMTLMHEPHEPQRRANETTAKVTQFFSLAAGIYLHLITDGFEDSYALQQLTTQVIIYMRTQITADLIAGLVCPLFIVGCAVYGHDDQELLRETLSSYQFLDPLFRHRAKLLPILEEIWSERLLEGYSWSNVVQLTHDILLI